MGELNEANQPKFLTRTPLQSVDWNTFFEAVGDAFRLHLTSTGPPGQKAPLFTSEYPKEENGNFTKGADIILYHVVSSVRAGTDPTGKLRLPKGPTIRERKPHPTKGRYSLVTFGWWELMTVRFSIYARSRDRADELTTWFHKMMMRYTFDLSFFKARGVHYMTFDGRGEDKFSKEYGQELYTRTLDYKARIELLHSFELKDMETVHIQLDETAELDLAEQYPIPKP